ncbi:NUDIX hydrolase [Fibrella arboris]|uniref:NUDIX hydrolase n=1 Tax=Fibrella arboris TaxID=3242486 RepID=UPI003521061C
MEQLEDAPKFKFWKKQLELNGLTIHKISDHFIRRRHNGEVLFAMLTVDADTPEGDKIPPVCFLKGHAASVLVCLIDDKTGEKFVVLVRQRRISDGSQTYEHPAGMVDVDDDPTDTAAREVGEEIGLQITPDELTKLNPRLWYPSTGTSDEAMHYYFVEKTMSRDEIMRFHLQKMDSESELERITSVIATIPEAHKLVNNVNGLLIHYLYLQKVGDYDTMKLL